MVLKKRLDYGFNGFLVPTIPRGPRSVRSRNLHKKNVDDVQICAFELLALAGKLLQESESSASSNHSGGNDQPPSGKTAVKDESQCAGKPIKAECTDPGSCENSLFFSDHASEKAGKLCNFKAFPKSDSDIVMECNSMTANSNCLDKACGDMNCSEGKSLTLKTSSTTCSAKIGGGLRGTEEATTMKLESEPEKWLGAKQLDTGNFGLADLGDSKDSMDLLLKSPAMAKSGRRINMPSPRDTSPSSSFSRKWKCVKLGSRDDDENYSRRNKFGSWFNSYRAPSKVADRRIRKLLNSKYWKVAPKLRDCEISTPDRGAKAYHRKRKTYHGLERCQHNTLFKRRKHFDQCSAVTSDGEMSSESVSNSPEKGMNVDKSGLAAGPHGGSSGSSSLVGHQGSFHSKDSHVKFRIKSFKVPEFFIEVPENATVGLLKKMVMEAVTAVLGGGLHVGVLLHGKKVKDDGTTLLQSGLSCKENMDTVGFMLEPKSEKAPQPSFSADPPPLLSCDALSQPLTRAPGSQVLNSVTSEALPGDPLIKSGNQTQSNHELLPSHTDMLTDKPSSDCNALVVVPDISTEALAVVPINHKGKRSDLVQRRTRRPFSVSEVEALVQAVEELGTGRWRDVKLRAFENADHRTYVDLKDKWKTLVHTARISPKQRRGEPVPQELLDRVLAAHGYWSQQQAKQNGKHQGGGALKLTEDPAVAPDGLAEEEGMTIAVKM